MNTASLPETSAADEEAESLLTLEEFLALPDDDEAERWLIQGRLIERPMSRRSYPHSDVQAQIVYLLKKWLVERPVPRGKVLCGDAGFRLRRQPSSTVGVDVAYASAEQVAATPLNATLMEGAPVLAVEILSPSDQYKDVSGKIAEYLSTGTALVWRVEPLLKIITVFRPDTAPQLFTVHDEIAAEPHLPGFRARVAEIFS